MKLEKTPIDDLFILHKPVQSDERGIFCRLFGTDEIEKAGRRTDAVHVNSSTSKKKGTLRGIHFQYPPFSEAKVVSCVAGSIWDVAVDLRVGSKTKFQWFGHLLNPCNGKSLIIPEGFGHAFITLEPNTTVIYVVSTIYAPDYESGARYDDPLLNISWPIKPSVISKKDQQWELVSDLIDELETRFSNGS